MIKSYAVKYKLPGSLFWNKVTEVIADGTNNNRFSKEPVFKRHIDVKKDKTTVVNYVNETEDRNSSHIQFVRLNGEVVCIPSDGTVFIFSKERTQYLQELEQQKKGLTNEPNKK